MSFLGPHPPHPKTEMMVRAEAQKAYKQYSIKELSQSFMQ